MNSAEQNAMSVFCAALERATAEERAAYLDGICAHGSELRARVEALLRAHDQAGEFLAGHSGASGLTPTIDERITEQPGTVIGPYKLLEQIGEGGFGVVFMAEQQEPIRRKVALKVLKPGMDSQQVIARFEAERQALALMDHPNIAKVLDAGSTETGRPYFVMELVRGLAMTEYCDQAKLPVRGRLELFVDVCQAVQHAHQKGIIHRDIKPSNVLVTLQDGKPLAKVIDFGVAKALGQQLTDKTLFTGFAQLIGTPLYMSPEQAALSNVDVDTRSDIYSLGVLLYELLTGTTPFERERIKNASFDEIRRIIREEEPPKPSMRMSTVGQAASTASEKRQSDPRKLSRLFRGELDWIAMKALEKERNRRYETASAFAADVQRYLHDEPVQACPPSAMYRLRKFARRNKTALTVAGLIVLFVALMGGGAGWMVQDKVAQQAKATADAKRAVQTAKGYLSLGKWQEAQAELDHARSLLAGDTADAGLRLRIEELGQDIAMDKELENLLLQPSERSESGLGGAQRDRDFAEVFRKYGIDVEALTPEEAADRIRGRSIQVEIAISLEDWALLRKFELKAEESAWKRLLVIARTADPDELRNQFRDALLADDQKSLEELAASDKVTALPASTLSYLGLLVGKKKAAEKGVDLLRKAQRQYPDDFWINTHLATKLSELEPPDLDEALRFQTAAVAIRPRSAAAYVNLSIDLRKKGLLDDALAACHEADRLAPDSATVHALLGDTLKSKGLRQEAVAAYKEAIRLRSDFIPALYQLGMLLLEMDELDDAQAAFEKTIEVAPDNAPGHGMLGVVLARKEWLAEAIIAYQPALFVDPYQTAANILARKDRTDKAIDAYQQALRHDPDYAIAHYNLGLALFHTREFDQAIAEYREAIRCQPKYHEAYNNLGGVLMKVKNDLDGAIDAFGTATQIKPDAAVYHLNLGTALDVKGQYGASADAYKTYTRLKPDDARGFFSLGTALEKIAHLDDAIAAYQAAIRLNANHAEAHGALGNALRSKGDLDSAISASRKAIHLNPRLPNGYSVLGNALTDQARLVKGSLEEAIAAHRKAVDLEPNNAVFNYNLGVAYGDKGSPDEAIASYREAVRLKPDYPEAWYNLGYNLRKKGLLDDAIAAFKEAIRLRANMVNGHILLGETLAQKGLHAEAVLAFKNALQLKPDNPWACFNLGLAFEVTRRHEEAIAAYRNAIRYQPNYAAPYFKLGVALDGLGRQDEAIAALQNAVRYQPDFADGQFQLARVLGKKGDTEGAIYCWRNALRIQPNDAAAHNNLAMALLRKNSLDEALVHSREAVRLKEDSAQSRLTLAQALQLKGDFDGALVQSREAVRIDSNYAEAYCQLAILLRIHGRLTESLTAMKRGHELGSRTEGWRNPSAQWVRDCERLVELEARFREIQDGKAQPKDMSEQADLALFCSDYPHLFDLSSRWYAEAFAAKPELAEDLGGAHRFNAARAAARAARGQGPNAAKLDDKERAHWRQQALDWLLADLALWTERLSDNKPGTGAAARQMLERWQRDPDLANLREEAAVANLPVAQQDACRKLWGDVRDLLVRVERGK
jgi:tetratricopeptide (TPR) repeat protein